MQRSAHADWKATVLVSKTQQYRAAPAEMLCRAEPCCVWDPPQVAAAVERQEMSVAELAAARRRTADAAAGSSGAAERAALWEGRAAGLQAKVCPPCSSTISPVVEPEQSQECR